jgi:hypothetical protein
MTFIQPLLLFALPLALLPVIIHFLNRLRYRTREWAAMMFLIAVSKSSTRHARLREFLILFFRCLAIAALIFALTRPLTGGWLGWAFSPTPDTILVLLDRSLSMSSVNAQRGVSKQQHALKLLANAAEDLGSRSRMVLLDSAGGDPHEIAEPSLLATLSLTQPTDTATSLPSMLQRALDFIVERKTGRTELWIASDMRREDWQPDSDRWHHLTEQLDALAQPVTVRLLALNWPDAGNGSISLSGIVRHMASGNPELYVSFDLARDTADEDVIPLSMNLNGIRSQADVVLSSQFTRHTQHIPLPGDAGGWGSVSIPADANERDNTIYFAYGERSTVSAVVIADGGFSPDRLRISCAPAPEALDQISRIVTPVGLGAIAWDALALAIWQTGEPGPSQKEYLQAYLAKGGVLAFFPPQTSTPQQGLGFEWGPVHTLGADEVETVAVWDSHDGPLADVASGDPLPLAELQARRYRSVNHGGDFQVVARFTNGDPFLLRLRDGGGTIYVCTTQPDPAWSTLSDGFVLVPMIQRMMQEGGARLSDAMIADCGDWSTPNGAETWRPVDASLKDPRVDAGVYRHENTWLALNRPSREDATATVPTDDVDTLFGRLPIRIWEEPEAGTNASLQAEIWRIFLYFMLISLLLEALLILPRRTKRSSITARATA